jgi:heptosyltransferase II
VKILVRATNWVGDAVMCIPALEAVRRRWPSAEIVVLGRAHVAGLYRGQDFVDRVLVMEELENGNGATSRGSGNAARILRDERFDAALLLPNSFASAWLAWRAGVPERIGYARDARRFLLTRAIRRPRAGEIPPHESYYYLELLRRAGWLDQLPVVDEVRLRISPQEREQAASRVSDAGARPGAPRIAVCPGAAYGSAKCWAPERYAALADRLIADCGASVILFGTLAERGVTDAIAAGMRHRPVNLAGQTSVGELPALFAACDLFVGNDSGGMHVAAAAGIPVVAIFGPTDLEGTAPLTRRRTIVREPVSCSPCFLRQCPIDHRCMTRIAVDAVYDASRVLLERR